MRLLLDTYYLYGLMAARGPGAKVGRMCAMNAHLHGIGGDKVVVHTGHDSLSAPWNDEYSMVLANPPFRQEAEPPVRERGRRHRALESGRRP